MTREQEDRVIPEQAGSQYDRNPFRFRKPTSQRPALSDVEEVPPHSAPPHSLVLVVGSFVLAQVILWSLVVLSPIVAHADTGQSCPQVVINEVVTDPQRDWNDPSTGPSMHSGRRSGRRSAGGDGISFNATPGAGSITSSDEWTELLNVSDRVLNLIDWRLVMTDTTPATEVLGAGSAVLRFSHGGSLTHFQPGERLVIGNPAGSMNNDVYLQLLDAAGNPSAGSGRRLPGQWVGSARVESQGWFSAGSLSAPAPNILSVAELVRYSDPTHATSLKGLAYPLLTEAEAFDWQTGPPAQPLCPGPGCIGRLALSDVSASSEIAIQNLVPQAGLTNLAIFLYDQNGLVDILCETLNSQQLEYMDLATWGYINPGFKGSAVISATAWEHPVFDHAGRRQINPVGLAGVIIERGHADAFDTPGDQSAGSVAFPLTAPLGNQSSVAAQCP